MFSSWLCTTVIAVCWVEYGLAIRKNVNGPQGVTFGGGRLGREADCKDKSNSTCDGIWWLEKWGFALSGDQFVSQGPQSTVTFKFTGNEIYVYGIPSRDNGAIAIFTLDNMLPERVDTSQVNQVGSDSTVLWSRQGLDVREHTLIVDYDPQSRGDGVVRYLWIDYFSYNDASEALSPPIPVSSYSLFSSTLPAPTRAATIQPLGNGKFTSEGTEFTWSQYVTPTPILGAVLCATMALLLFGTAIFLCKRRQKRWQDTIAPEPFINSDNTGESSSRQFPTSFPDSFSSSMMNSTYWLTVQEITDPSQRHLQPRSNVNSIDARRDFPPPPRPPPTSTIISYGDQIAETLSTGPSDDFASSMHEPRGYRLRIPGSSYRPAR